MGKSKTHNYFICLSVTDQRCRKLTNANLVFRDFITCLNKKRQFSTQTVEQKIKGRTEYCRLKVLSTNGKPQTAYFLMTAPNIQRNKVTVSRKTSVYKVQSTQEARKAFCCISCCGNFKRRLLENAK